MEKTTVFGLASILIVIQFTGLSHGQLQNNVYSYQRPVFGGNIGEYNNEVYFDPERIYQNRDPEWHAFIENLDSYDSVVNIIQSVNENIIDGYATPVSKNYLKIIYALFTLSDKTMCNNATSYYNFIYYGTVAAALLETSVNTKEVATTVFHKMQAGYRKIIELKDVIETTNATCNDIIPDSTIRDCDKMILNYIVLTHNQNLEAEAQVLSKYANLARLFLTYHAEFVGASSTDDVLRYLMKSRTYIRPLVQRLVWARLQTDFEVPDC